MDNDTDLAAAALARAAAVHEDGGGPISIDYLAVHAVGSTVMQAAPDSTTKAPYGDVTYADPGYQADKKKRYPLDDEDHVRSAWSYINQDENASQYSAEDLAKVKSAIQAAGKKLGIKYASAGEPMPGSGRVTLTLPDGTVMQVDEAVDVLARGDVVAVHTAASAKGGMDAAAVASGGDTGNTAAEKGSGADSTDARMSSLEDRMTNVEGSVSKIADACDAMMNAQQAAASADADKERKAKLDKLDEFVAPHVASALAALDQEPVLVGRDN